MLSSASSVFCPASFSLWHKLIGYSTGHFLCLCDGRSDEGGRTVSDSLTHWATVLKWKCHWLEFFLSRQADSQTGYGGLDLLLSSSLWKWPNMSKCWSEGSERSLNPVTLRFCLRAHVGYIHVHIQNPVVSVCSTGSKPLFTFHSWNTFFCGNFLFSYKPVTL